MTVLNSVLSPVLGSVLSSSVFGDGFTTVGSAFDGTNDFQLRGGDLTNNVDGKKFLVSFWFKFTGGDGVTQRIIAAGSAGRFFIYRLATNKFQVVGRNAANTAIIVFTSTGTYTADGIWHNFLASGDLAVPGSGGLFIDDIDDEAGGSVFTDDTIDYTQTNHAIGSNTGGTELYNGQLSQIYLNYAENLDLSVVENRRKFINGGGEPVNLGPDGSAPTGASPIVYAPDGDGSDNRGYGGPYVTTGALERVQGP